MNPSKRLRISKTLLNPSRTKLLKSFPKMYGCPPSLKFLISSKIKDNKFRNSHTQKNPSESLSLHRKINSVTSYWVNRIQRSNYHRLLCWLGDRPQNRVLTRPSVMNLHAIIRPTTNHLKVGLREQLRPLGRKPSWRWKKGSTSITASTYPDGNSLPDSLTLNRLRRVCWWKSSCFLSWGCFGGFWGKSTPWLNPTTSTMN